MAKNSKRTVKKTKTATINKKFNFFSPNKLGFLLFAALFASIGIAYLLNSSAQEAPARVVAAYINETPEVVELDEASQTYKSINPSARYAILEDGSVYCAPGNVDGSAKTGKIGKGVVKQIQGEIGNLNIKELPQNIAPQAEQVYVNQFEGFLVSTDTGVIGRAVYPGAEKPDKLAKMQEKLVKACEKADKRIEREQNPNILIPTFSKADKLTDKIASAFIGKAYATPPPPPPPGAPYRQYDQESRHVSLVNSTRVAYGKKSLERKTCLDNIASEHSQAMLNSGYIYHSDMGVLGNKIRNYCGIGYWSLAAYGENVGMGTYHLSTADALFQGFMNSPSHRDNILSGKFNKIGVGQWKNPNNDASFATYIFAKY